jgi:hypothetical protein
MSDDAIRFLELHGSPFERGVQHGREIADSLSSLWDGLVRDVRDRVDRPITEDEFRAWLRERAELARSIDPDLVDEIRGIAAGGSVDDEVAVAVAFLEEVSHLANSLGYHHEVVQEVRCLSAVVPPSRTTTNGYLLAQTWDGPDWSPDPILFAPRDPSGWSAYLADPGSLGGPGVNDRGIGSVHTGVLIKENPVGNSYSFIARRIMKASSLEIAAASVSDLPSSAGSHYIVVQDENVIDVEAAGAVFESMRYDGLFSTCAHFVGKKTSAMHSNPEMVRRSRYRTDRLTELVASEEAISALDLMAILADHKEGPQGASVCLHASKHTGRSLGVIVIDVASRTIFGRAGNPCLRRPIREVQMTELGPQTRVLATHEVTQG